MIAKIHVVFKKDMLLLSRDGHSLAMAGNLPDLPSEGLDLGISE